MKKQKKFFIFLVLTLFIIANSTQVFAFDTHVWPTVPVSNEQGTNGVGILTFYADKYYDHFTIKVDMLTNIDKINIAITNETNGCFSEHWIDLKEDEVVYSKYQAWPGDTYRIKVSTNCKNSGTAQLHIYTK